MDFSSTALTERAICLTQRSLLREETPRAQNARMKSLLLLLGPLLLFPFAAVANDGFEFHGGRKKRRTHGLNQALTSQAPRRDGQIRFDSYIEAPSQIYVGRDEAPPAPKVESRLRSARGSKRKEEDTLLLPDRYSVLNFEDIHRSESLTLDSSWWGRLYIKGFPTPQQYFRAHFGSTPPSGEVKLVLASPLSMCDDVTGLATFDNGHQVDDNTIIVANRGGCTFGDKAIFAHELGAAGILFINNEEGNFHASAPIAHDLPISAAMIGRDDGVQLIRALQSIDEANDPGFSLKARYVAQVCGDDRVASNSTAYCHPIEPEDQKFVESLTYKGKMSIEGSVFQYVQGEFGSWIDPTKEWTIVVPSIIGGDSQCCDASGFDGNVLSANHAVICQRGECEFATKSENVGSTGAGLLVVSSHNATIYRMGVDPPSRGRQVSVATSMVTADAYEHMVHAHYSALDYGMTSKLALLQPNFSNDSCDESESHD